MIKIDEDIVVRCQRGEKEAFRCVVLKYQRMVFSLALKMLCDEEEAKDMVRVWQSMEDYDRKRSLATWIYTIAARLCLDRLKSKRRVVMMPGDEQVLRRVADGVDVHRALENEEWVALVWMMAEGLSEKQRLVFTLAQLEGLSSSEVEEVTGLNSKQVKSNLYVARQTIRERLKLLGYE